MLKFVLLSMLFGASLAMVEEEADDLHLSARRPDYCDGTGCSQTDACKEPDAADGVCVLNADETLCLNQKKNFYKANNSQCGNGCHCLMKCRPLSECSSIGGKCVRRDQACGAGYTKKNCGCKTKNKCSCCVPNNNSGSLTCP